jgi:anti-anti-sigma factor
MAIEISTFQQENCDLVSIIGRVDSYTAPKLAEVLRAITDAGRFNVVLDLTNVSYVSSAGLRVLIDVQKACRYQKRGEAYLVNVPQRVYDTLELAGFVPLFKIFDDINKAIQNFPQKPA